MRKFSDLINELHNSEPQPNPNYYNLLMTHADTIVFEVALHGQTKIAEQLKMSQSKLSGYYQLLKAQAIQLQRLDNEHARG